MLVIYETGIKSQRPRYTHKQQSEGQMRFEVKIRKIKKYGYFATGHKPKILEFFGNVRISLLQTMMQALIYVWY